MRLPGARRGRVPGTGLDEMIRRLRHIRSDESGQAFVEYALILGVVAATCAVVVSPIGAFVVSVFTKIAAGLGSP
jgi:Flp pilus assembly pilin Flp